MPEAVKEMRLFKGRRAIQPTLAQQLIRTGFAGSLQYLVDQCPRVHVKGRVRDAQTAGQLPDEVVI